MPHNAHYTFIPESVEGNRLILFYILIGLFLHLSHAREVLARNIIDVHETPIDNLRTSERVQTRDLQGCGGPNDSNGVLRAIGPVKCPCFLSYQFNSDVEALWDMYLIPEAPFLRWEANDFAGLPSDYNRDYTFFNEETSPLSPITKLDESNLFIEGDYFLVFAAADQAERCFTSGSTFVFESMPSPCPVETRVVGGTAVTKPDEYNWIVSIWFSDIKPICGGSLIAPGYVLTAAHCRIHESPQSFEVRIGVLSAGGGEALPVIRAWAHEGYKQLPSGVAINDLAILEIGNFDEEEYTHYIELNKNDSFPAINTFATTAGFGHISENWPALPVPNRLLRVDLPIVAPVTCDALYERIQEDIHLCAGYIETGGCDSCQVK